MKVSPIATITPPKPWGKKGLKAPATSPSGASPTARRPYAMKTPRMISFATVSTFSARPVTSVPRALSRMNDTPITKVTIRPAPCSPTTPNTPSASAGAYLRKNSQKYPAKPSA